MWLCPVNYVEHYLNRSWLGNNDTFLRRTFETLEIDSFVDISPITQ